MLRSIVFTSGKGGVGKTTLTLNVGRMLASRRKRVVIIDTDIGLNNLDVMMNVESNIVYDLFDVVSGRCRVKQALTPDSVTEGLYLIPSCHDYGAGRISGQNLRAVLLSLAPSFDFALIDCPAGVDVGFHRAVSAVDEAFVVTTPHLSAIKDAAKAIALVRSYKIEPKLIVNRVRGDRIMRSEDLETDEIISALGVQAVGIIPDNDNINMHSNLRPLVSGEGQRALSMMTDNIEYGTDKLFDATRRYRGFFGAIRRGMKKDI